LPDKNFNKKPNSTKKRPEKGQTDCLKARRKAELCLRYCYLFLCHEEPPNCKNIIRIFSRSLD